MKYKFTLLKELPDYPVGTVFKCCGLRESRGEVCYRIHDPKKGYWTDVECGKSILDNPEWVKKEIDIDELTDFTCPKCGSVKGNIFSDYYKVDDIERDDYGIQLAIGVECICGHRRLLYGTKYGRKRMCDYYGMENECKKGE